MMDSHAAVRIINAAAANELLAFSGTCIARCLIDMSLTESAFIGSLTYDNRYFCTLKILDTRS